MDVLVSDPEPINSSEALVAYLARKSFLSLWCYANPRGKPGKELCDILVVCDPHVIIVSVKDTEITDSGHPSIDAERWVRRAVEESAKQIYGAERHIRRAEAVVTREGEKALPFPDSNTLRIHRLAVAFGSKGRTWIPAGDFGKGFVHVFDEVSLLLIMGELDTITDFVEYLERKEAFLASSEAVVVSGEENLLASYLGNDREFPDADLLLTDEDAWAAFTSSSNYRNGKIEDEVSRIWDGIIEEFCKDYRVERLIGKISLTELEHGLRYMARERRFCRRMLGRSLVELLEGARKNKLRSRYTISMSGVAYVFLACPLGEDRKGRRAELGLRCLVVRRDHPETEVVVGIATEIPGNVKGHSLDLVFMKIDKLTDEQERQALVAKNELGYFKSPVLSSRHEDERPHTVRPLRIEPFKGPRRRPSRNAPCPCGSGRKFKRCCGRPGKRL